MFGILYDVCMIDRRRYGKKSLVFELSIGNAGNRRFSRDLCDLENDDGEYDDKDEDDNDYTQG